MKRKYEVKWYDYNLTQEKSRKFFTKVAAVFFAAYMEAYQDTDVKVNVKE